MVELQRRQRLKKIFKLVLLAIVFCSPYLWWIERFISIKPHTLKSAVFPLHARFNFLDNFVHNVSGAGQRVTPDSPGLKILSWHDVTQPETYYGGVRPLHNIAIFAEIYVRDKTYFMLIDTGSEVSWLFCEPPFGISKDEPTMVGPHDLYRPSLDSMILYKELHPPGFYACYQDRYLCAIRKVIGLCLKRHSHRPPQQVVGYLSFGDEVVSVPEQMTWIQTVDGATIFGFAAAFLKSVQVGTFIHRFGAEGQSQQNAKIVFDTGTTVTYLVPDVYYGLIQYVKSLTLDNV